MAVEYVWAPRGLLEVPEDAPDVNDHSVPHFVFFTCVLWIGKGKVEWPPTPMGTMLTDCQKEANRLAACDILAGHFVRLWDKAQSGGM